MILSNIKDETEQYQLLEEIEMKVYRDDMQELVYTEYGDEIERELAKKDKELAKKDKELAKKDKELAKKDKELAKIEEEIAKIEEEIAKKDDKLNLLKKQAKIIEEINAQKDIPLKTKK